MQKFLQRQQFLEGDSQYLLKGDQLVQIDVSLPDLDLGQGAAGQIHAPDLEHGGQLLLGQVKPLPDRPQPRAKTLVPSASIPP